MNAMKSCADPASLEAYLLGCTSEAAAAVVEEHLALCVECRKRLPTIRAEDDFVADFRAQARRRQPKNAFLDRLAAELHGILGNQRTSHDATPPADRDATPEPGALAAEPGDRRDTLPAPPREPDALVLLLTLLSAPQSPDELGRLGDYRVLKVLGLGGMGVVFLAEDVRLRRHVALKAMKPELMDSARARQRFLREARLAASLTHDNVVAIHQVGEEKSVVFLVMPLLQGETLEERLKREGRLPFPEVLRIGRETAEGLAAAHERGLIHRDVKPANLWLEALLGARSRVKVLDFGLARASDGADNLTQTGMMMGTPAYMAPEQADGRGDHRADLFSLGCVLYRMATGRLPFEGDSVGTTLAKVATDEPRPPRELYPQTPQSLSDLILCLLAKDPVRRPQSAGEVIQAIQAIERDSAKEVGPAAPPAPVSFITPAPAPTIPEAVISRDRRRWHRFGRRGVAVLLSALLLLFGVIAVTGTALLGNWVGKGPAVIVPPPPPPPPTPRLGSLVSEPAAVKGVAWWDIEADDRLGTIDNLDFTVDGRRLSVYHYDPTDYWRKTWDFNKLDLIPTPFSGRNDVLAPDGKSCARPDGRTVQILGEGETKPRLTLSTGGYSQLKWAPDGSMLAQSNGESLRLWDADGHLKWRIPDLICAGLAWTADGKTLFVGVGQRNGGAKTVDVASGKVVDSWQNEQSPEGERVSCSAAGDLLAISNASNATPVSTQFWAGKPLKPLVTINDRAGAATVCSPDGKWAAYGDKNGVIKVYDVQKKEFSHALLGHDGEVTALAVSPDGRTLVSGGHDKTVRFWDMETGRPRGVLVLLSDDQWLAVSAEGYYHASPKADGMFRIRVKAEGEKAKAITPKEFADKYGWKNDPDKVHLTGN